MKIKSKLFDQSTFMGILHLSDPVLLLNNDIMRHHSEKSYAFMFSDSHLLNEMVGNFEENLSTQCHQYSEIDLQVAKLIE